MEWQHPFRAPPQILIFQGGQGLYLPLPHCHKRAPGEQPSGPPQACPPLWIFRLSYATAKACRKAAEMRLVRGSMSAILNRLCDHVAVLCQDWRVRQKNQRWLQAEALHRKHEKKNIQSKELDFLGLMLPHVHLWLGNVMFTVWTARSLLGFNDSDAFSARAANVQTGIWLNFTSSPQQDNMLNCDLPMEKKPTLCWEQDRIAQEEKCTPDAILAVLAWERKIFCFPTFPLHT